MKLTVLFALMLSAGFASAKTLNTCTPQLGPDQKIEIVQNDDGSITLEETALGASEAKKRVLSANEWSSKRIMLRSNDTLLLLDQNWLQAIPSPGSFTESGPADCR